MPVPWAYVRHHTKTERKNDHSHREEEVSVSFFSEFYAKLHSHPPKSTSKVQDAFWTAFCKLN